MEADVPAYAPGSLTCRPRRPAQSRQMPGRARLRRSDAPVKPRRCWAKDCGRRAGEPCERSISRIPRTRADHHLRPARQIVHHVFMRLACACAVRRLRLLFLQHYARYLALMLVSLAFSLAVAFVGDSSSPIYSGRAGHLVVTAPRVEADVRVDGTLDQPVWAHAARLTDFSQFLPVDGVPAADSTIVLVFSSRRAIYFGIRAYEAHGAVHATLADRDRIAADDYVQIFLDTSHDHRTAYVFGVNPLGVQADAISRPTTRGSRAATSPTSATRSRSAYHARVRIRSARSRDESWRRPSDCRSGLRDCDSRQRDYPVRQASRRGHREMLPVLAPARYGNVSIPVGVRCNV